ncbi:oligosaccharide flippase family protein [Sphingomonas psychrotolerans]|uniref:Oligosaccharide flippase family protein n=1 Tax=Sphingomonas psychrotolerans TaxID=1327635 RepID=A0ABU3N782_9SPHN|nr:oligosaccharide flippase family protein [Sphingomonas psychrotolerans]MDT8759729.1 oligosaccharide flippase family protein [Sphingomonas psychrotolerans]
MIRAVATILRGSVFAQAIGFAILPLLSRNLQPEAFGHFQAFQAIIAFLLIAVTLRYEIAVLRAEDDEELAAILGLCGILMVGTTLLVSAGLLLADRVGWPAFLAKLGFPWWLLSLSMLAGGAAQLLGYVATRAHAYGLVANSKMAQAGLNAGVGAGLAWLAPVSTTLILADLAGRIGNLAWLARGTLEQIRSARAARWAGMRAAAIKFRDLSTISLPSTLLSTAGTSLTPLLIYASFDAATSGQFGLVERSVGLPTALVVVAVSQVHMAHLATDIRTHGGEARRSFRRIALLLGAGTLVPMAACILFATPLYRLVFGPGWEQAASFAQLMAPAYWLSLITGGINMTLTVVGRQKTQFAWDASRFAAMALLWLTAPAAGWPIAWIVAAHSALISFFSIALLVLSYRALPHGEASLGASDEGTARTAPDGL